VQLAGIVRTLYRWGERDQHEVFSSSAPAWTLWQPVRSRSSAYADDSRRSSAAEGRGQPPLYSEERIQRTQRVARRT
jgi:hypothetical protein